MKNFRLIFWSELMSVLIIENEVELKLNNGEEVLDYVVNNIEGVEEDYLDVEGDVNDDMFNIVIGEESNCMVFVNYEGKIDRDLIIRNIIKLNK